jgi:hypothetical protein
MPTPSKVKEKTMGDSMNNKTVALCQLNSVDKHWSEPLPVVVAEKAEIDRGYIPSIVDNLAHSANLETGMDYGAYVMSFLTVLSGCASDEYKIQGRGKTWKERPKIWTALIAGSGTGKSQFFSMARSEVTKISQELANDNARIMAEWRAENKRRAKNKSEEFDELPPPITKHLAIDVTTLEWAYQAAAYNPRGLMMFRGELGSLLRSKDTKIIQLLLEMLELFDGGPRSKATIKTGEVAIKNWSAAFLTTVQPDIIRTMNDDLKRNGFVQRFLPIMVPNQKWVEEPISCDARDYYDLCRRLWHEDSRSEVIFELDTPANKLAEDFLHRLFQARGVTSYGPEYPEHMAKYPIFFYRLCLLFHLIEGTKNQKIHQGIVYQVVNFMQDYLIPNSKNFYCQTMQSDGPFHLATSLIRHLKALTRRGELETTTKEISQTCWAFKKAEEEMRTSALLLLQDSNWIRLDQVQNPGRRPRKVVLINPKVRALADAEASKDSLNLLTSESLLCNQDDQLAFY